MYRMGVMSLLASDCGVDSQRCIRLALVHDIAEAIVGDITPHCNVSEEDKFKLEADAVQQMKQMLGPHTAAGRLTCHPLATLFANCVLKLRSQLMFADCVHRYTANVLDCVHL